ncbi:MAG: hypothetical protein R2748_07070 [Bryobacterales bacterium]
MTRRDWLSLAALAGAGCHKEGGTVIGVAPKGTSSIFWQSVQAGSLAAARNTTLRSCGTVRRRRPSTRARSRSSTR